jgi:hypothetical protein
MVESEVTKHAFELMFAFDEVIALGYRENVNLAQVKTFTEMESNEENIAKMVQKVVLSAYSLDYSGYPRGPFDLNLAEQRT